MNFAKALLSSSLLFLVGCGGPRVHVDPEWKTAPESVTILVTEPYVDNDDDVVDDFNTTEAFREWSVSFMNDMFKEKASVPTNLQVVPDEKLEIAELQLGDEVIQIPLPKKGENPDLKGYVLTIHPVHIYRYEMLCHSNNGCINNKSLNLTALYSVVSMDEGKILAYGYSYAEDKFTFAMTKGNWEDVFKGMVKQVLEDTPLRK